MNKVYRVVWNQATNSWVVASEMAKGRKKSSLNKASVAIALGSISALAAPAFALNTAGKAPLSINDVAFGVNDPGVCNAITADQNGGGSTAGFYNVTCNTDSRVSGIYNNAQQTSSVVVADNSLSVGGYQFINGKDSNNNALTVTASGANIQMNQGKVTNLANGTAGGDSVNISQLTPAVNALGGGANINSTTGVVTGPTYTLSNANRITGASGTYSTVGSALTQLDTAVGTPITFAGNSGSAARGLGQTLNISGGASTAGTYSDGNIKTVVNSTTGTVDVQMADAPNFAGSVTAGGTINANGGITVAAGKTVNMGGNKVTNVAAGSADTDAVNMSQLNATNATINNFAGDQSTTNTNTNGRGIRYVRTNDFGLTVDDSYAQGQGSTAVGYKAKSVGVNSLALGNGAMGNATDGVALGSNSVASTASGVAGYVPTGATSAQQSAVNATKSTLGAVSVGNAAGGQFRQINGVAAGTADSDAVNVAQLKAGVTAATANSVMYDDSTHNSVTMGGTTYNPTTRTGGTKITNVAAGVNPSDAVNKQQLDDLGNTPITFAGNTGSVAKKLGDTVTIKGGASTAGTYSDSNVKTVVDASGNVDVQFADAPNFAGSVTAGGMINANGGITVAAGKTVNMGGNKVTNVAAGSADTDAVNMSQLNATNAAVTNVTNEVNNFAGDQSTSNTTTNGRGIRYVRTNDTGLTVDDSYAQGQGSTAVGYKAKSTSANSLALGNTALASSVDGIAMGHNAIVNGGPGAIAIGTNASAQGGSYPGGSYSVALGYGANADSTAGNWGQNTAIGGQANANTTNGVAVGFGATASATSATALGYTAQATGGQSLAMGYNAQATVSNGVALGSNAVANTAAGVAGYDPTTGKASTSTNATWKSTLGAVSVGGNGQTRQITNLAAGAADTDAVNVAQLKNATSASTANAVMYDDSTHNSVTMGGTTYNPTTRTGGTKITNVAAGVNPSDAVNKQQLDDLGNTPLTFAGNSGSVAKKLGSTMNVQGAATTAGTYSGANLKTVVDANGVMQLQMADAPKFGNVTINDSGTGKITGVTAGTADTDAVNMSQLNTTNAAVTNVTNEVNNFAGDQSTNNTTVNGRGIRYVRTNDTGLAVDDSYAQGVGSTAVGYKAKSTGASSLAVGNGALSSAADGVALGSNAVANTAAGVAGYDPATGKASTSTSATWKSTLGAVSVGGNGQTRQITNLAAGAADTDAVNVAQLKNATSAATANAVMYDDSTHNSITLGGTTYNSTTKTGGTKITNVARGTAPSDAVNVQQLNDLGNTPLTFAGNSGSVAKKLGDTLNVQGAATTAGTYSGANLKTVVDANGVMQLQMADAPKFGNVTINDSGTGKITGVTAGTAATDAVNVSQLSAATSNAVQYDDGTHNNITLGGTTYNSTTKTGGTKITNVARGTAPSDAVNVQQLNDLGNTPLTFAGNSGSVAKKLGDTLNVQGAATTAGTYSGANLKTVVDANGVMQLQMADAPKFGNVTINDSGTGKITGVTAGTAATDAVNVSQLTAATSNAVMYDNSTHTTITLAGPTSTDGGKTGGTKIKNVAQGDVSANSTDAVNGAQLYETNQSITNLGNTINNFAGDQSTTNTTINGRGIRYVRTNDTGLAVDDSYAQGVGSTAVGYKAKSTGASSLALGRNAVASADNSVALGANATTTADLTKAAYNPGTGSVAGVATGEVSVGSAGAERRVTNVAAGADDTDAVNVSQLKAVQQSTDDLSSRTVKYDINNDGSVNYNSITLGGNTSTDGGKTGGTKIHNVAQGDVSANSTDAINGAQLYDVTGDTSNTYVTKNGKGVKYVRTNDTGLDPSDSSAQGVGSTAVGYNATAIGDNSVAMGRNAQANNAGDVALGQGSVTAAAVATTGATIAGTQYSFAGSNPASTVSVGSVGNERTITNVAAGRLSADSTDAVNGSQLYATNQAVDVINSTINNINGGGGIKYFHASSSLDDSQALGVNSVAIGPQAVSAGANSVALGNASTANADNSVALGAGSVANQAKGTAGATIAGDSYSFAGANPTGTVSVGSQGQERTITNVAAGEISATSTDAVNGSQLYATNQAVNKLDGRVTNVENTVNNIAGDITNIRTGQAGMFQTSSDKKAPTPTASGSNSAAGGSGAVASGDNSLAVGNGSQATAANSVAIGNASVADRANSVSVGSAGNERQITNVAAGSADTDAVNVSQLKTSQAGTVQYDKKADGSINYDSITLGGDPTVIHNVQAGTANNDAVNVGQLNDAINNTQNWAKSYTDQQVNKMGKQASAGTAAAMAMAGLPQAYQPNQSSAGVSAGTFRGQSAIAVGLSTITESGRYIFKVSGSANTKGDAGVAIGAGMVW